MAQEILLFKDTISYHLIKSLIFFLIMDYTVSKCPLFLSQHLLEIHFHHHKSLLVSEASTFIPSA